MFSFCRCWKTLTQGNAWYMYFSDWYRQIGLMSSPLHQTYSSPCWWNASFWRNRATSHTFVTGAHPCPFHHSLGQMNSCPQASTNLNFPPTSNPNTLAPIEQIARKGLGKLGLSAWVAKFQGCKMCLLRNKSSDGCMHMECSHTFGWSGNRGTLGSWRIVTRQELCSAAYIRSASLRCINVLLNTIHSLTDCPVNPS